MAQPHSHLTADTAVVAAAGHRTAGTAGAWSEWGVQASIGFTDSASAVRNAHLSLAVSEHSATWNPVVQRVSSQVNALGSSTTAAAVTVDDADVANIQLLAAQTGRAGEQASELSRPVNTWLQGA